MTNRLKPLLPLGIGFFALVFFVSMSRHDFYVSNLQMEVKSDGQLQLILRVFTDDLEMVLQQRFKDMAPLNSHSKEQDSLLMTYLEDVLVLEHENAVIPLEFLGKEIDNDITRLFLEGQMSEIHPQLTLHHRLFLEEIPNQQNLVHIRQDSYRKSYLFDASHALKTINLAP